MLILADNYPPRGGPDGTGQGHHGGDCGPWRSSENRPTWTPADDAASVLDPGGDPLRGRPSIGGRRIWPADDPGAVEFFEKAIRPILAEKCQKCHGGDKTKGGLSLTGRESVLKGGDSGPAAVPGKPRESLLIEAVEHRGELKMPPKGKLTPGEIDRLGRWIELGLPWPEAHAGDVRRRRPTRDDVAIVVVLPAGPGGAAAAGQGHRLAADRRSTGSSWPAWRRRA